MLVEALVSNEGAIGVKSRHWALRTIDVARRAGCSVQQVRNLEAVGVLPPAARTAAGYRRYADIHVQSAVAYRALAAGAGPVEAKTVMRTAHQAPVGDLLALLDSLHARLDRQRREVDDTQQAVAAISAEPMHDPRPADAMTVSELADALGIRASTLRHWDAEGLLVPSRSRPGGRRIYSPEDVRDARVIHQLRQAGYGLRPLQHLLPQLRLARRHNEVGAALLLRRAQITARSRALLRGAASLEDLVANLNG